MNLNELPNDLVEFLRSGAQLRYDPEDCEPGKVGLSDIGSLKIGEVWIGTDVPGDPNLGADGYYSIPAVSLTSKCAAYDPEFILLWLPNEHLFGTWDSDHWVLTVFPEIAWSEIVANPSAFLGAQWDANSKVGTKFKPWRDYRLQSGGPF